MFVINTSLIFIFLSVIFLHNQKPLNETKLTVSWFAVWYGPYKNHDVILVTRNKINSTNSILNEESLILFQTMKKNISQMVRRRFNPNTTRRLMDIQNLFMRISDVHGTFLDAIINNHMDIQ